MHSETIEITTQDGVADAYLVQPQDGERHPAVLLLMDAFGLRPQIERMADRIAARGFAVLAPNVLYRAGPFPALAMEDLADPGRRGALLAQVMPLVQDLTPERIVRDGAAYLDLLEEAGRGPVAITGYCMGGRLGWRIATAYPDRVAALGCFHTGGLANDGADSPHLSAGELQAELYLGYADNDQSMTREQIATVEHALDDAGVRYASAIYEGAAHGYTMADTPVYDEAAAERHFSELFALLDRTVAVPG
ncbi:MAG TPA: dienelactone hydrolase family protein [Solirubrobacteraceae bacterium]|jgi:carboxymethylenebutenolidase|nr:dienelactone hydrolase family protein [Solirubrobacteraceae bacterium]